MKKLLLTVLIFAGLIFISVKMMSNAETVDTPLTEKQIETGPVITTKTYTVVEDDTFTKVMEELGVSYSDALLIVERAEEVFNFTSIKLGKSFKLVLKDGVRDHIEYEPGTEYMIVVDLETLESSRQDIEYDVEEVVAEVVIDESMFLSGLDAGLSEVLILELVEVLAWEVDFATQVQTGDSYKVLYEKRYRDGKESGIGDVLAATFTNVGDTVYAYRYLDESGDTSYYNEKGESLVRQFLKAPLSYSRISSGYTYARFHPVLQKTTEHRAIDYAAPIGTPIMAVADGTITQAGWNGGYGIYVDIRHNSIYETQYAHLSKLTVSYGDRVKQGDVIGYVGSTGFSTGPHLHYQVKVSGSLVNPLEVEFPAGDAISEEKMGEFERQRDELKTKFE